MDRIGIFASQSEGVLLPKEAVSSKSAPFEGVFCFFASLGQEMGRGEMSWSTVQVEQLIPGEALPFVEEALVAWPSPSSLEETSAFFDQYFEIDEEFILEELAEGEGEILQEEAIGEVDAFSIETLAQDDSDQRDRQPSEEQIDPV